MHKTFFYKSRSKYNRKKTAAHCVTGKYIAKYVSVGSWNRYDSEEEGEFVVMATNIRIHPKYKLPDKAPRKPEYDLAILDIPDLRTVSTYKK